MAVNENFILYVTDQMTEFGSIETKRMFGGIGIFKEGIMFAMIAGDKFKLKVDERNRGDFEALGMKPHFSGNKKKGMPYWEVPIEILEDKSRLAAWAHKSYQIAVDSKK